MLEPLRKNGGFIIVGVLLIANFLIWQNVSFAEKENVLTVAFLDVGQGDSIYIEGPNGGQILIDGGPNGNVLSELGKVMPFGDRTIDLLIVTNPDQDHYGGFLDVLKTYDISHVIEPGTRTPNKTYREFKRILKERGVEEIIAERGMNIPLGNGALLEILFPDRDVSNMSRNDGSIIARLQYGSTSVMFTGDTTKIIEEYMVNHYPEDLPSSILKVAHHGSKTSTGKRFVDYVAPTYAIISNGKDNSYGHPHQNTLKILSEFGAETLRTDILGTIIFQFDGKKIKYKNLI